MATPSFDWQAHPVVASTSPQSGFDWNAHPVVSNNQPTASTFDWNAHPVIQQTAQPITSTATIGPRTPSVWDRIKGVFSGIPAFNRGAFETAATTNAPAPPMQVLTPEAAMTPVEQAKHPVLTGIGQVAGGMTSPGNLFTLAGTGGLGEVGEAASIVPRLMSAGFGANAIYGAIRQYPEVRAAAERGDVSEVKRLLTVMSAQGLLGGLALSHAATGRGAITGRTGEENAPKISYGTDSVGKYATSPDSPARVYVPEKLTGEQADAYAREKLVLQKNFVATRSIPSSSPTGEVLRESAPDVRIVDSAASKQALIRVFHGTTGNVEDISQLKPEAFSRVGAAGVGAYISESGEQAGHYTPAIEGTLGRVLGGELSARAKLLDGNKPLPRALWDKLSENLDAELPDKPLSYMQVIQRLHEDSPTDNAPILEFQKQVADADYDGVRYEHVYPTGIRKGIMLFGEDVAGRPLANILRPAVPTARIVSPDHIPDASQSEILSEAVQRIFNNSGELQRLGLDPSRIESPQDVTTMLNTAAAHIERNIDPRVGRVISFDAQKQLAADLNMDVTDLLKRESGEAWNAERLVAARAMLKASQTNVMNSARLAAMGDTDYQAEFARNLAQHQAILDNFAGARAEAGRALGSFNIREAQLPQAKITNALAGLPQESLAKAAQLLSKIDPSDERQVNEFVQEIKPASTPDKVFEYFRNALLSGPHTIAVKAASEATMMTLEAASKIMRGGIEAVRFRKDDPQAFASEAWWYGRGALRALQHAKDVMDGTFTLADMPDFERTGQRAIKGKLGQIVRLPSTILSRQTNLMWLANYYGEIEAQAARQAIREGLTGEALHARQAWLAANPTPEISNAASETALHNTFQSQLGKFGTSVSRTIQNAPGDVGKFLFPFYRTPVNLIKASGEYSPYGIFKALAGGKEFLGTGEALPTEARTQLAVRGLVGSSILAGLATLALDGRISGGGPIDFKKRQTLQATGWQPYSIRIGNKWYSYHRAEPIGLMLGLVADTVHGAFSHEDPEITQSKADNAWSHVMRNLDDLPFVMTLSDLLANLHGSVTTKVQRFVQHEAASFVPAIVGNVAQMSDRTVRVPQTLGQAIEARIPGMTANVPAATDIAGRAVQRPVSALGGINPFPASPIRPDPVVQELGRLGMPTPQPPKSVKLRGREATLTPEESNAVAAQEGREFASRAARLMASTGWARLTDDERRTELTRLRGMITAQRARRLNAMRQSSLNSMAALGRSLR